MNPQPKWTPSTPPGYLGIWYRSTRVIWEYDAGAPGLFGNLAQKHPGYLGILWEYGTYTGAPWLFGNLAQEHPARERASSCPVILDGAYAPRPGGTLTLISQVL